VPIELVLSLQIRLASKIVELIRDLADGPGKLQPLALDDEDRPCGCVPR